jgi:hypothetical protein
MSGKQIRITFRGLMCFATFPRNESKSNSLSGVGLDRRIKFNSQPEAHSAYFLSLGMPLMDYRFPPRMVAKHN